VESTYKRVNQTERNEHVNRS